MAMRRPDLAVCQLVRFERQRSAEQRGWHFPVVRQLWPPPVHASLWQRRILSRDGSLDRRLANVVGIASVFLLGTGNGRFLSLLTVTVLNTGDAPLHVGQFVVTGIDAADFFVESETCPIALDPASACVVFVGFSPRAPARSRPRSRSTAMPPAPRTRSR